jgi:hypothetical protein
MAYSSICQEYAADLSQYVRQSTPLCAVFRIVLNCVPHPLRREDFLHGIGTMIQRSAGPTE